MTECSFRFVALWKYSDCPSTSEAIHVIVYVVDLNGYFLHQFNPIQLYSSEVTSFLFMNSQNFMTNYGELFNVQGRKKQKWFEKAFSRFISFEI